MWQIIFIFVLKLKFDYHAYWYYRIYVVKRFLPFMFVSMIQKYVFLFQSHSESF